MTGRAHAPDAGGVTESITGRPNRSDTKSSVRTAHPSRRFSSAAGSGSLRSATVSLVDGLFEVVGFVGIVLVTAGLVMILMAWGGMDERMPTQVPPKRLARYPLAAGTLLLAVAAVGLIVPGG